MVVYKSSSCKHGPPRSAAFGFGRAPARAPVGPATFVPGELRAQTNDANNSSRATFVPGELRAQTKDTDTSSRATFVPGEPRQIVTSSSNEASNSRNINSNSRHNDSSNSNGNRSHNDSSRATFVSGELIHRKGANGVSANGVSANFMCSDRRVLTEWGWPPSFQESSDSIVISGSNNG